MENGAKVDLFILTILSFGEKRNNPKALAIEFKTLLSFIHSQNLEKNNEQNE